MQGPGAPHFACTGCSGLYGGRLVRLCRGGSSVRPPGLTVPGCRCLSIGEVFRALSGVPPGRMVAFGMLLRRHPCWTAGFSAHVQFRRGQPFRPGCRCVSGAVRSAVPTGLLHPSDPFPDVRSEYTGCLSLCRLRLTSACKVGLWGCAASRSGLVSPASRARYAPVRCRCRRRAPRPAAPGARPRRVRRRSGRPTARRVPDRPA